jgi:hypothetical protein
MDLSVWELWLPILVSGVVLFFASAAAWMALPHHKPEWKVLPNEDAVMSAVRNSNVPPGQYMFPYCASAEAMKSEEMKSKLQAGPLGTLCVWPGQANMGLNMVCSVIFFIIVSFGICYLATMALQPGDSFWHVFRFTGTAGILNYASAPILNGIWFRRKMLADIADGIAYGLITGVVFGLMWPGVSG